jgi:hypothetical protein
MTWRSLPNGDKFAPQRGGPPSPPEGYCIDAKNKYLAHPILGVCAYRFTSKETLSCGKVLGIIECSEPSIDKEVTQMQCFTCEVPNAKKMDSKSNQTPRSTNTNGKEKGDVPVEILLPEELIDTGEETLKPSSDPR